MISRLETEQAALVVDTGTERKWPSQAIMSPFNSPSNVEKKYCAQKSRPNQITKLKLPSCNRRTAEEAILVYVMKSPKKD